MEKPDLQSSNQKDRETGDKWVDNEWTMSQRERQLFEGRNTLKGREKGKEKSGHEMTDRDKHRMKTKKKERKG